jgi:hypothetical protein
VDEKNYHCYDFMSLLVKSVLGVQSISFQVADKIDLNAEKIQLLRGLEKQYTAKFLTDVRNNSFMAFIVLIKSLLK